ncbi:MAG: PAS domain S-box protein, partial [Dehalococcoidales bacterium]|nr:PAS domain S-box protein [Dehalococcoidales bacterium]
MLDDEHIPSPLPDRQPATGDDSVLLAATFASSAEGIAFVDGDLIIRRVNAAFAAQLRLPLAQIEGRPAEEVIPGWAGQVGNTYQRIRETGVPFQATAFPFAFKAQPERGITYWDSSIAPAYCPDGAFRGYLLLQREVTDRVQARQQLQEAFAREQAQREELQTQNEELQTQHEELQTQAEEIQSQQEELQAQNEELVAANAALLEAQQALALSEAHYRRIVETTLEGVWQIDAEGRTTFVNERMAAMLGYSVEEMRQRSRLDFLDEEGRRVAEANFARRRRGIAEQYDLKFRRKDGADLWTIVAASPIFDVEGNYAGVLWMVSDITERKQAEEDGARLAAIVQYSEDPIIGKTLDGIITSWNPAATRHYGYSTAEAVGQPITIIVPPDRAEEWSETMDRIRRGERVEHYETVRVRKGGERVDVSLSIAPIRDVSGHLVGASTIASDITERKRAEAERERLLEQLQLERERWHATVESMPDLVAVADAQGRVTYINPAYSQHIGYLVDPNLPLEEHPKYYKLYRPDGTMFAPEDLPLQRAALTGEEVHDVEVVERTADGREFTGLFNAAPLHDAEGHVVGAVVVGQDITERKRAEEEREHLLARLQQANEQLVLASTNVQGRAAELDATIGAMADGVIIFDAAGNITRANEGALRLLGVAAEEARWPGFRRQEAAMLAQRADGSPFPPAELPGQRALRGETVQGVVMGLRQPSGGLVWVSASAAPIKGPAGEIRGAVSTFTDITQLRKLEEDREDFVRAVSHDLRQPLTVVGGQAQMVQRLLERKGIDGRLQGSLEAIRTSAGRMGRMIEDLVQSARLEAGQLQFKKVPMDLRAHVLDLAQQLSAAEGPDRIVVE